MKKVTAKDIANACGISQATVSYVINNKEGKKISEKTRQKVLETAKALQYTPNSFARAMRTKKSMTIGVVTGRNCMHLGFNRMLRGIKAYVDEVSYSIMVLKDEGCEEAAALEYVQYYRANKVDGILFTFFTMTDKIKKILELNAIPYLDVDENGIGQDNGDRKTPYEAIVEEVVGYSKAREWVNIGLIQNDNARQKAKRDIVNTQFNKSYSKANVQSMVVPKELTQDERLIEAVEGWLARTSLDLVVSLNQHMGLITQHAILKHDFTMPQHIKHICLGDTRMLSLTYPTVTSIKMPLTEIGGYAAQVLIDQIDGKAIKDKQFEYTVNYLMSTQ